MAPNSENGWIEYRRSVLENIQDNKSETKDQAKEIGKLREEIAVLKVKAGVWGLVGGAIPVAIFIALRALGKI